MENSGIKRLYAAHPKACYYVILAVAVTVLFFATQAYLIAVGKELIWTTDSKPLYVNFLFWSMNAFDEVLNGFLNGQGIVVPMYTYALGYGADAIVSMGAYLQDPINIFAYVFPKELIGISYPLMALVRVYLAAVAFSIYCFGRGHDAKATFVAAMLYVTCGFILYLGVMRHPKFIDWAILLPLALRAADLVFENKGRAMFVVVMFFQFVISVYYLYMTCLVLLVYCLIKYFLVPRERSIPGFCKLVLLFLGLGVLAFLFSGPFSIPQIMGLLSQGRVTGGRAEIELLFPLTYYLRIPVHLIGADANTEGMICCGIGIFLVLVFMLGRKHFDRIEWRTWMIAAVICFIGLLVPYFGHVMNGMGYSTDRWMLILGFVFAYIACLAVPKLPEIDKREWKRVGIGVGFIAFCTVLYAAAMYVRDGNFDLTGWPLIMAVVFVVACLIIVKIVRTGSATRNAAIMSVLVITCASISTCVYCSSLGAHWVAGYSNTGAMYSAIEKSSPAVAVQQIGDEGLYRYSEPRILKTKNSALDHEPMMGIDFYTSYYNQAVDDFRQELGISDHHMNFSFCGHGSRLALENLTGVKYFVTEKSDKWRVPYGFVDTGEKLNNLLVYENTNPMPMAFLVENVIDRNAYEAMTMVQRQEALLQGAVVDTTKVSPDIKTITPEFASQEIPFKIVAQEGVTMDDGVFHVLQTDATLTLEFEGLKEAETYLSFENLSYDGYTPSRRVMMQGGEVGKRQIFGDLFWSERTTYPIKASIGKRKSTMEPATPRHRRFGGKVNWVLNVGYFEEATTKMTVTFSYMGDYTYDAMKVICQPVEPIVENSKKLASAPIDDLELHRNGFSATANLDSDDPRIALFTIAYGTGWSVKVDGEPAEVIKADTGFLGVEVRGEGAHSIEWKYETPGLRIGAYMFIAGLAIAALICGAYFYRRRKSQP